MILIILINIFYPLVPLLPTPAMMYFFKEKNTIKRGMVTSAVAANWMLYTGLASDPVPTTKLVLLKATEINQFFSDGATN